jgi:hypothetical protein
MHTHVQACAAANLDVAAAVVLSAALVLLVADTAVTSIVSKDYCFSARQVCDYALLLAALLEVAFFARGGFPMATTGQYYFDGDASSYQQSGGVGGGGGTTATATATTIDNKVWLLAFPKLGWIVAHANDVKQVCGCCLLAGQRQQQQHLLMHPAKQPTSISRVLNAQIAAVM